MKHCMGKKCISERKMLEPDSVEEMIEIVRQIRERIKEAQDKQKSYANVRKTDLQSKAREKVFLKVSHKKG